MLLFPVSFCLFLNDHNCMSRIFWYFIDVISNLQLLMLEESNVDESKNKGTLTLAERKINYDTRTIKPS